MKRRIAAELNELGYGIKEKHKNWKEDYAVIALIRKDTGESTILPRTNKTITINGHAFNPREIYIDYYNMDDASACQYFNGCSIESSLAIQNALTEIGCIDITVSEAPIPKGLTMKESLGKEYTIAFDSMEDVWYAFHTRLAGGDAFPTYVIKFRNKPDQHAIWRAIQLEDIRVRFRIRSIEETKSCHICGKSIFWLDLSEKRDPVDAFEKMSMEYSCGCAK